MHGRVDRDRTPRFNFFLIRRRNSMCCMQAGSEHIFRQTKRFFISDAVVVDVGGVFGELSAITCVYHFLVLFGAS